MRSRTSRICSLGRWACGGHIRGSSRDLRGIALALAVAGIYGVVSFTVTQRTREIGIRVAVGASPRRVVGMVARSTMTPAAAGGAIGLCGAWFATRALSSLLAGISPHDPWAYGAVIALLAPALLAATYGPARRAASVNRPRRSATNDGAGTASVLKLALQFFEISADTLAMEKRRELRYTIGQAVTVTILSGGPFTHPATVKNGSGNGIALDMPAPVTPGAALQIILEDSLLLGEAMYCSAQGDRFLVGVLLDSKLSQLSRLGQMLEAFAEGEESAVVRP
jgi:FtsX-like permease family